MDSQTHKIEVINHSNKSTPFLSIITRCYQRPTALQKNQDSIILLNDKDVEQILIIDEIGHGLHEANKSFGKYKELAKGKYVFILDDDDYLVNPNMIGELKKIHTDQCPDIIFVRMKIGGAIFPKKGCWGAAPSSGSICTGCVVVKNKLFQEFIHHFGTPRCGDAAFISKIYQSTENIYWHDSLMSVVTKISNAKPESKLIQIDLDNQNHTSFLNEILSQNDFKLWPLEDIEDLSKYYKYLHLWKIGKDKLIGLVYLNEIFELEIVIENEMQNKDFEYDIVRSLLIQLKGKIPSLKTNPSNIKLNQTLPRFRYKHCYNAYIRQ